MRLSRARSWASSGEILLPEQKVVMQFTTTFAVISPPPPLLPEPASEPSLFSLVFSPDWILAVSRNLVNSLSKERASWVPPKTDTNFFTTGRQRKCREELEAVKQNIIPLWRGLAFPFSLWAWSRRSRSHSCMTWNRAEIWKPNKIRCHITETTLHFSDFTAVLPFLKQTKAIMLVLNLSTFTYSQLWLYSET